MLGETVVRRPKTWAFSTSLATLMVGAVSIVLAEFGGPVWVFFVSGLWLWTAGLPTTLAVLGLAAVWGNIPGMTTGSFGSFVACAALLALGFQTAAFLSIARVLKSKVKR